MKNNIATKRIIEGVLMVCFIVFGYAANAQNKMDNFGGTWTLNEDKSDFGRLTAASASKVRILTIEQTASSIAIASGDSTTQSSVVINLEGKPSEQVSSTIIYGIPNTLKTDIGLQILNNRSFISTLNKDPLGMATSSVKTYTISEDGKTLTIEFKNAYGEQILAGKLVYDKKQQ